MIHRIGQRHQIERIWRARGRDRKRLLLALALAFFLCFYVLDDSNDDHVTTFLQKKVMPEVLGEAVETTAHGHATLLV